MMPKSSYCEFSKIASSKPSVNTNKFNFTSICSGSLWSNLTFISKYPKRILILFFLITENSYGKYLGPICPRFVGQKSWRTCFVTDSFKEARGYLSRSNRRFQVEFAKKKLKTQPCSFSTGSSDSNWYILDQHFFIMKWYSRLKLRISEIMSSNYEKIVNVSIWVRWPCRPHPNPNPKFLGSG